MHIYVPKFKKYLSHDLKLVSKKSSSKTNFIIVKSSKTNTFSLKTPKNEYISYEIIENNSDTMSVKLSEVPSEICIFENKYLYVAYLGTAFTLTFEENSIFFSSSNYFEDEQRRIELVRDKGICSTSIFHNNNYKGLITELLYEVPQSAIVSILEMKMLYNQEDSIKHNINTNLDGTNIENFFEFCEPCGKKSSICKNSLGIKFSPQMFGNRKLTRFSNQEAVNSPIVYNEGKCILHFSPDFLEGRYYHINTTNNNGFISENPKSYTDSNIKELTPGKYYNVDVKNNSKNYDFLKYELIVRDSVPLSYLRHITFFDKASYDSNKVAINNKPHLSCSFM